METLSKDYGLYGLLLYVLIKEVWPFFRDKLFPEKIRFAQAQEERFTVAIEGINKAVLTLATNAIVQSERLTAITNSAAEHDRLTSDAVTAMLVKTKTMPKRRKNDTGD